MFENDTANIFKKEILTELFDSYIQMLEGLVNILEATARIKKIEKETGAKVLRKSTIEDLVELLSKDEIIKLAEVDPEFAKNSLIFFGKTIRVMVALGKLDLEKAEYEELLKIAEDLKSIIELAISARKELKESEIHD